ncbi:MAG: heat-shock protein Hsp70 [Acidobacteria bacterium]|nr:heat-shock protein Hsp70 [Acidobacteriota bacterium]
MSELIVGIDLGTTNSEVAAFVGGEVRVLGPGERKILPSVVGISPSGELLVGESARNQHRVYPERTVRSIKRRMGTAEKVDLGDKQFSPSEISSLILRELVEWAHKSLGQRPEKAVITVPAYFSDAQRNATREAGALAGLDVVRILNEPTAASLAYGYGEGKRHTAMVYDLGGGTFDVSIVTMEGDITEVLASHGNNHLGGDDFDDLLAGRLAQEFEQRHGVFVTKYPSAKARLWWAAEEAKKRLSFEPYVKIREEALVMDGGKPLHLEVEISREEYEQMIQPLVETTFDSVSKALRDSGKSPGDLDAILLVGGSTRTPLVSSLLRRHCDLEPRQDVHPDLCVALGAGVMASRLSGQHVDRVLVDVSPYSFGVAYLGDRGGFPYPHCYKPIVQRNTPLPLTRTERFYTTHPEQTTVEVRVFQGEDEDALKNVPVGDFRISGLAESKGEDLNEVLCRMRLDLDGILEVTAIEKQTGKSKQITIAKALEAKSEKEIAEARSRLQEIYGSRMEEDEEGLWDIEQVATEEVSPERAPSLPSDLAGEADQLLSKARTLLGSMHPDDREETIDLIERITNAMREGDVEEYKSAAHSLSELIFFVGGKE